MSNANLARPSYTRSLELMMDGLLFGRAGLANEPAAAACLVRAALAASDRVRAQAVNDAVTRLDAAGSPPAAMHAARLHCQGVLERDPGMLEAAAVGYPDEWSRASAAEDLAWALIDAGDASAGLKQLRRSNAMYHRARAADDVRRVHKRICELESSGVARPRAEAPGWDNITDTELQVIDLASRGLTNQAIADKLYLSPHTIAFHLRQVYRKLAVGSRVQLTRLVAMQPLDAVRLTG
jgi:DNA-binding CsgD family transcriptional regulator